MKENKQLEEGRNLQLDFQKLFQIARDREPVVPVVVQHADTRDVLILAYANREALDKSLLLKRAVFWSTSRREIWTKGGSSGNYLELLEVRVNCEQNSLLYLVRPVTGGVCHTRGAEGRFREGCYYRRLSGTALEFI